MNGITVLRTVVLTVSGYCSFYPSLPLLVSLAIQRLRFQMAKNLWLMSTEEIREYRPLCRTRLGRFIGRIICLFREHDFDAVGPGTFICCRCRKVDAY